MLASVGSSSTVQKVLMISGLDTIIKIR